jgi:hypothetical protein
VDDAELLTLRSPLFWPMALLCHRSARSGQHVGRESVLKFAKYRPNADAGSFVSESHDGVVAGGAEGGVDCSARGSYECERGG